MRSHVILILAALVLVTSVQVAHAEQDAQTPPDSAAASAAEPAGAKSRLLLLNLEALAVDAATARIIDGLMTDALHRHSAEIELLTAADMRQMLDLEAQKQDLGCSDESCLSELAGAMGARYVVFGQVGKLDNLTLVQLSLFDSREARSLGRQEIRTEHMASLADSVQPAVDALLAPLLSEPSHEPAAMTTLSIVGAGLAGVGLLAALGLGGTALWMDSQLGRPASEVDALTKQDYLQTGPALLVGTGLAGLVAVGGATVLALGWME